MFSDQHRADVGWTDIYVRSENPTSIADLSITKDIFVESLVDLLPPFDRIGTGYSTYTESCTETIVLGRNDNAVVFAEHDAQNTIIRIWLTLDVYTSDDAAIALKAFQTLSQWPLIMADWGWSVLLRLSDSEALTEYFSKRVNAFEQFSRKLNVNKKL